MCLFLSHTLMTRPAACASRRRGAGRSRRTSSSSGSSAKKSRAGGGAPCESRKTVFCDPCPVASDFCHDQASAWLLGDVAEEEKSSSVAGVRVM